MMDRRAGRRPNVTRVLADTMGPMAGGAEPFVMHPGDGEVRP
jgi:hypothetical protein